MIRTQEACVKSFLGCMIVSTALLVGCDESDNKGTSAAPTTVPTETQGGGTATSGGRQPSNNEQGSNTGAGHGTGSTGKSRSSPVGTGGSSGDPTGNP
ncbi:MAG TPA: hypothetical protein VF595_15205 [Tepidisphaeraceae bacterium]